MSSRVSSFRDSVSGSRFLISAVAICALVLTLAVSHGAKWPVAAAAQVDTSHQGTPNAEGSPAGPVSTAAESVDETSVFSIGSASITHAFPNLDPVGEEAAVQPTRSAAMPYPPIQELGDELAAALWLPVPPLATPSPFPRSVERWRDLVERHWPSSQVPVALCVMRFESHGIPDAHNTAETEAEGGSAGLFQIAVENLAGKNRVAGLESEPHRNRIESRSVLLTPDGNIRMAAAMWRAEGWLPAWLAQRQNCELDKHEHAHQALLTADAYMLAA